MASHREDRASHREAGPLTGRQSLSQGGRDSHREAGSLTGRLGLSQGGLTSHREAGLTIYQLTT